MTKARYTPDGEEYPANYHRRLKKRFHTWCMEGMWVDGWRKFKIVPEDLEYFRRFYRVGYHVIVEGMRRGVVVIE